MAGAAANLPCDQSGMAIYKEIYDTITLAFYTLQLARLKVDDVQLKTLFTMSKEAQTVFGNGLYQSGF